ncbi:MAG: hypothetical protein AAGK00_05410 [Pseudomonadota bacterium]
MADSRANRGAPTGVPHLQQLSRHRFSEAVDLDEGLIASGFI